MAGEKNFENRLKKWLESEGVYPLGEPVDRMKAPPCGYYEKRWGGGRYVKAGLLMEPLLNFKSEISDRLTVPAGLALCFTLKGLKPSKIL